MNTGIIEHRMFEGDHVFHLWINLPFIPVFMFWSLFTSRPQRRLHGTQIILATVRILHRLGAIPEHDSPEVTDAGSPRTLQYPIQLRGGHISAASTITTSGSADIQFRPLAIRGEILAPRFKAVFKARLPDVAITVVVELDEDKVHALHRVERDTGVRARALRRRGDVVALARVRV